MRALIIGLLVAIVALAGGLAWVAVATFLPADDTAFVAGEPGTTVDGEARFRIIDLEDELAGFAAQMQEMQTELQSLRRELERVRSEGPVGDAPASGPPGPPGDISFGTNGDTDQAAVIGIPTRREINAGLTIPTPTFLEGFLGRPRESLSDDCQPMTNPKLRDMLRTVDVGPIRVSMLEPAAQSLTRVFENVRAADPHLYARIQSSGSLCVRQIRGTRGRTSTHSFGLALDINIDGKLDTLGDGKTQVGLITMSDFFLAEGWVWGAAYSREDSMHFEVSREKLQEWRAAGLI